MRSVFLNKNSVYRDTRAQTPALRKSRYSSPMGTETDDEQQETDMVELENSRNDDEDYDDEEDEEEEEEEESPKLVFKFSYQIETFERLSREGYRDGDGGFRRSSPPTATAEKYETFPAKNLRCVVEEPKAATFRVGELFCESINVSVEDIGILRGKSTDGKSELSASGKDRTESYVSARKDESEELVEEENSDFPEKILFLTENDFLESTDSSQTFTSHGGGFLSDSDFEEHFGYDTSPEKDSVEESHNNGKNQEGGYDPEEESNGGLESLWEHQDLIEQLQMELKKVKAIGLPTIQEDEDESPKIVEDLKPWKIEEKKLRPVDTIGELHKFYRSYRERMRKLDILSYQKMYALGLLQSKDPLQAISAVGSSSPPAFTSVFPVSLQLRKPRKPETEPMVKFVREIHGELENVYVGQMCLSWEILHWQYEKAIELWESDACGVRRYNEVAGEFQQFQVLIQRFMENEPFEVPRIQHYVKKRCALRNLLHVPVIRGDGDMDKRKGRRRELDDATYENAVTSEQLVEIMEESIRLFWRFVRSDKRSRSICKESRTKSQVEPEDPEELGMLADIKSNLQKKEKRLKEVLNSEKCIIRRLKKKHEEGEGEEGDQELHLFFSQVDMRLVARVLNMSKLTKDHLVWCHDKLSKINFVNRELHLDPPSFCLFPC
ncbi:PREDICTED: uncharacterized protein LOC104823907 [Tarenaya hassleriana]|uniref:uncharacterized protein LOC104823907 n=1 Tax=Tarenaya hassleriana TaxID=28532 RepID=UPI00053C9D2F|nr:PREDICTED: uncharacterized protein LOC104823907 [Tarenaya hassleriana]